MLGVVNFLGNVATWTAGLPVAWARTGWHADAMLVGAYKMFWDRHAINWKPGSGPDAWVMLGRIGERRPKLQIADFRRARGVYVLFNDHGAYYAGKAGIAGGIGGRLKQQLNDGHKEKWDRFCWFSFDALSKRPGSDGLYSVRQRDRFAPGTNGQLLREMEGLLVTIMNTRNEVSVNFVNGQCWEQILGSEEASYLARVV